MPGRSHPRAVRSARRAGQAEGGRCCPSTRRARSKTRDSVHVLRHAFAVRLYEATHDVYQVEKALGHATVAVTEGDLRYPGLVGGCGATIDSVVRHPSASRDPSLFLSGQTDIGTPAADFPGAIDTRGELMENTVLPIHGMAVAGVIQVPV